VSTIAAIILAAGRSTRFEETATKLVAEFDGIPLVRRVAQAALASRAHPAIVVTGHHAEDISAALRGLDVRRVHAADYERGLAHSLRSGLAAVAADAGGVLVLLADMPLISAALIDHLIAAFEDAPDVPAVIPVRDGRRGNPVLVARKLFPTLTALDGDRGARQILLDVPGVLECPIADEAIFADVDTVNDLRTLNSSRPNRKRR
jgi:molybdenum cofactor cytidylyltransferase